MKEVFINDPIEVEVLNPERGYEGRSILRPLNDIDYDIFVEDIGTELNQLNTEFSLKVEGTSSGDHVKSVQPKDASVSLDRYIVSEGQNSSKLMPRNFYEPFKYKYSYENSNSVNSKSDLETSFIGSNSKSVIDYEELNISNDLGEESIKKHIENPGLISFKGNLLLYFEINSSLFNEDSSYKEVRVYKRSKKSGEFLLLKSFDEQPVDSKNVGDSSEFQFGSPDATVTNGKLFLSYRFVGDKNKIAVWSTEDLQEWDLRQIDLGFSDVIDYNLRDNEYKNKSGFRQRIASFEDTLCIAYYGIKSFLNEDYKKEIRDFRVIVSQDSGSNWNLSDSNYSTFTKSDSNFENKYLESQNYLGMTAFFIPFSVDDKDNKAFNFEFNTNFDLYYDKNMGSFVILKAGDPYSVKDNFENEEGEFSSSYLIGIKTKDGDLFNWEQCLKINLDSSLNSLKSKFFEAESDVYNFLEPRHKSLLKYSDILDVKVIPGEVANDLYLICDTKDKVSKDTHENRVVTTHSEFSFVDKNRFDFSDGNSEVQNFTAYGGSFHEDYYFCSSPISYHNSGYHTAYSTDPSVIYKEYDEDGYLEDTTVLNSGENYYSIFGCKHLSQNIISLKKTFDNGFDRVLDLCFQGKVDKFNELMPYNFNFNSSMGHLGDFETFSSGGSSDNVFKSPSNGNFDFVTTINDFRISNYHNFVFNSDIDYDIKPYNFKLKMVCEFSSDTTGNDFELKFLTIGFIEFYINQDGDVLTNDSRTSLNKTKRFEVDFDKRVEIIVGNKGLGQTNSDVVICYRVGDNDRQFSLTDFPINLISVSDFKQNPYDDIELGIIDYDNYTDVSLDFNSLHYGHYNFVNVDVDDYYSFFDLTPVFTKGRGDIDNRLLDGLIRGNEIDDNSIYNKTFSDSFYLRDSSNIRVKGQSGTGSIDEFKFDSSKTKNIPQNVNNGFPDSVYDFTNTIQNNKRQRLSFLNKNLMSFSAISFLNIDGVHKINLIVENVDGVLDHKNIDYKANSEVDINSARNLIDGEIVSDGDLVLLDYQSNLSENGIYVVNDSGSGSNGSWSRAQIFDQGNTYQAGYSVYIDNGLTNSDELYTLTSDTDVGSDDVMFARNSLTTDLVYDELDVNHIDGDIFNVDKQFLDQKLQRYSILSYDADNFKWVDQYKIERNYEGKVQVNKDIDDSGNYKYFLFLNSLTYNQFDTLEPIDIQDLSYDVENNRVKIGYVDPLDTNSNLYISVFEPDLQNLPVRITVSLATDSSGNLDSTASDVKNAINNHDSASDYLTASVTGSPSNIQSENEFVTSGFYLQDNSYRKFALDFHTVKNPELVSIGEIVFGNLIDLNRFITDGGLEISESSNHESIESNFGKLFNENSAYENPFNLSNILQSVSIDFEALTSDNRYFDKIFKLFQKYADEGISFPILFSEDDFSFTEYGLISGSFNRGRNGYYKTLSVNVNMKDWMAKENRTRFELDPIILEIFTDPDQVLPGQQVTFEVDAFDPLGGDLSYNWDMGDGTQKTGRVVNHSYQSSGDYQVRCEVTSDFGFSNVNSKNYKVVERLVDDFSVFTFSNDLDEISNVMVKVLDNNGNVIDNFSEMTFEIDTGLNNYLSVYRDGVGISSTTAGFETYRDDDFFVRGSSFSKSVSNGLVSFYIQSEATEEASVEISSNLFSKSVDINTNSKTLGLPSEEWFSDFSSNFSDSGAYVETVYGYLKGSVEIVNGNKIYDTSENFRTDFDKGVQILNLTDGSKATISSVSVTDSSVTTTSLIGGDDNSWSVGDIYQIRYVDGYVGIYDSNNFYRRTDKFSLEAGSNSAFNPNRGGIFSGDIYTSNKRGTSGDGDFKFYFIDDDSSILKLDESGDVEVEINEYFTNSDIGPNDQNSIHVSPSSNIDWNDREPSVFVNDFNKGVIHKLDSDLQEVVEFSDSILNGVRKFDLGFNDVIYCIHSNLKDIFAFSVSTGNILWTNSDLFSGDDISSISLNYSNNKLYLGSSNGDIEKINIDDGASYYQSPLSTNSSSLSVTNLTSGRDNNIYGSLELDSNGNSNLFKLDKNDSIDWKASAQGITSHQSEIKDISVDWYFNIYTIDSNAQVRKVSQ